MVPRRLTESWILLLALALALGAVLQRAAAQTAPIIPAVRILSSTGGELATNGYLSVDDRPADWFITADSAANAAQTLTKAAVAGQSHYVTAACVGTRGGTVTASDVMVEDGATAIAQFILPANGTTDCLPISRPLKLSVNSPADLVILAGGVGVITVGTLHGYTK